MKIRELLKIIVIDAAGAEHIFNELPGEVENYLDLRPEDAPGVALTAGTIKITTRSFSNRKFDTEVESFFISPRRIDIIYDRKEALE